MVPYSKHWLIFCKFLANRFCFFCEWQEILDRAAAMNAQEKQKLSENLIECLYDISKRSNVLESLGMHSLENLIRVMLISLISPEIR